MTQPTTTSPRPVAIVTGGNRGLGRSTVLALADQGVDTILTFRSHDDEAADVVDQVAKRGGTAVALRLDTGDVASFDAFTAQVRDALAATWGREAFDFLVNNAGHSADTPLGGTDAATIRELAEVHFVGVFMLTQSLVPLMSDGGRIVNLSSGLARFTSPNRSVYGSIKAAVESLTRYLAAELGPRRITVNVVAPGPVATDFSGGFIRSNPQVQQAIGAQTALGRVGEPEDIGPLVASLLTGPTGWVTGQRIEASGGIHL